MLRLTSFSQEDDRRISGTSHDDCSLNLWNRNYKSVRKDTISHHNLETKTEIPVREISASIDQSYFIEEDQRKINNAYVAQEVSLTLPYLYRHILIPPIFSIKTNACSYSKNKIEEQRIRSYLGCSPLPCYDCRIDVRLPIISTDQYQPIYQDIQCRNDPSTDSALSNNCILIYANGAKEKKENTTQYNKGSEKRLKSAKKRKPKDQPKRPLSAYNLFFQKERQKILSNIPDTKVSNQPFQRKRNRPKTPHGKIGFENLAKEIGQRWQSLDAKEIGYYKGLATQEMIKYKEAMRVFRRKNEVNPEGTAASSNALNNVNNHADMSLTAIDESDCNLS
jgi:hypothetical protein